MPTRPPGRRVGAEPLMSTHVTRRSLRRRDVRKRRLGRLRRGGLLVLALSGVCTLFYPAVADWFSTRDHVSEIQTHQRELAEIPPNEKAATLERARNYNRDLVPAAIQDPFTVGGTEDATSGYHAELVASGNDVMARLTIPKISVDLPIYYGTSDDVLRRGVGHVFGSSLPVGGDGTHAVLTAHSGIVEALLLTRLNEVAVGDRFTIDVFDETLTYQVDDIRVVEPHETESLSITPGKDYVTLITCTPTGVNSHRLLVRAARVEVPVEEADDALRLRTDAGFPWWAVFLPLALITVGMVVWRFTQESEPHTPPTVVRADDHPGG